MANTSYKVPQVVPTPDIGLSTDPNTQSATESGVSTTARRVSLGNIDRPVVNTQTRVKRGTGAATKGTKYSVNSN
jgi:hypothetical protein